MPQALAMKKFARGTLERAIYVEELPSHVLKLIGVAHAVAIYVHQLHVRLNFIG